MAQPDWFFAPVESWLRAGRRRVVRHAFTVRADGTGSLCGLARLPRVAVEQEPEQDCQQCMRSWRKRHQ